MILRPNDLSCVLARLAKKWEMEQVAKRANEAVSTVMASKASHITSSATFDKADMVMLGEPRKLIVNSATFDIPLIGGKSE